MMDRNQTAGFASSCVLLALSAVTAGVTCVFCRRSTTAKYASIDSRDKSDAKSEIVAPKTIKKSSKQRQAKVEKQKPMKTGCRIRTKTDLASLPPAERAGVLTAARAENAASELREKGRCETCALVVKHCICATLASLKQELVDTDVAVRFALWMHVSERTRASNTGKLMQQVLPDCEVFFHGLPADEVRFRARVSSCPTYVLFPSEGALPLADVSGALRSPAVGADVASERPLVVLVDGTWDQARRMHKALEDLPHVALELSDGAGASSVSWRCQSEEGRVTTAEACALALDGLACADATRAAGALRQAVAILDKALSQQTHYDKLDPPKAPRIMTADALTVSLRLKRGAAVDE